MLNIQGMIGRSLGEAHTTVRRHLDTLAGALVLRVLEPWYANVGKRLVKSPKVYVRDTGLLHALLGISERRQLEGHPPATNCNLAPSPRS